MDQRRAVVNEYLEKGFAKKKITQFAGLKRASFYYKAKQTATKKLGRPAPGFSRNLNGSIVPDLQILKLLKNYRSDINFQNGIGCRALHEYLELEHKITVNHKKICRICKQNSLLLSRKRKIKKITNLANNLQVDKPNQLWQFDIKYGYIHGENKAFYFLAFVDVFTKKVVSYHLGKTCTHEHLKLALKMALNHLSAEEQSQLIIRSDNGPQMSSNGFKAYIDTLELSHEFTPIRCPNKNAYVESFFSIFEIEFLQVRHFFNMRDVHQQVYDWVNWYNQRRLHSSLKYNSPNTFIKKINDGTLSNFRISA